MHVGMTLGPFVIDQELGSGAMGTVYRATFHQDGKGDRPVALKVIAFGLSGNDQALARFDREAEILKQLRHPNIVRLLATGKYKNTPFFAMEYVDGRSLDKIMADRTGGAPGKAPFTWEEVVEFGMQLCGALQHAHEKGIIHRDIKPSNLMLTPEGMLKLTDFGIAKDVDVTALTGANNTIGTAAYMSPEQCKGERNLTGKSDLYSLGVVFYELLTGRKPFVAESSVDMFLLHVNGTFVRPAKLQPDIPVWLDNLVCQMMEKEPDRRPLDASMVGRALSEIMDKVTAQQSAGADVASGRGQDRARVADEADRHAARAIQAGSRKKKLRKKRTPIYRRGWFVASACLLVLGGIGYTIWTLGFSPPDPEAMIARIESAKDNPDRQRELIADYLRHFANDGEERTARIKALDQDLKVRERARVLLNRYGNKVLRAKPADGDDADAYKRTMAALAAEDEGDTEAARTAWKAMVADYGDPVDSRREMWGWHAQKKLADLEAAEKRIDSLAQRLVSDFQIEDRDVALGEGLDDRLAKAVRYEGIRDFARAYTRWRQIAESLDGAPDTRALMVVARGRAKAIEARKDEPKDAAGRVALVSAAVARAQGLLADPTPRGRRDGRNLLREIRDLYTGEPGDLKPLVDAAVAMLAKATKS